MSLSFCVNSITAHEASLSNVSGIGCQLFWWPCAANASSQQHRFSVPENDAPVTPAVINNFMALLSLRQWQKTTASPVGGADSFWLPGLLCLLFCCNVSAEQKQDVSGTPGALQQLILVTGGAIGYNKQLLPQIESRLQDTRLFTVGIGAAPDSYFMVEAANVGRGSYPHISDTGQINTRMSQLLERLVNPGMKDITVDFDMNVEMFPQKIPDLYHEEPYHEEPLLLSYLSPQPISSLNVAGLRADALWRQTTELAYLQEHQGIAKYQEQDKIRYKSRQKRLIPATEDSRQGFIAQKIARLALKHQLVSPYVSLSAPEKGGARTAIAAKSGQTIRFENQMLMAAMPNTAAGSSQAFALALVALSITIAMSVFSWFSGRARGVYVSQ